MKKLSTLLTQREALLRQTRLANLAYAYQVLRDFAARVARSQLSGRVTLAQVAPEAGRFCATLTAHEASQSVIEEHFTDEDISSLADVVGFLLGHDAFEVAFSLENIGEQFLFPLRTELSREGIVFDATGIKSDVVM